MVTAAGPSRELHADYYGKHDPPIDWSEFRPRYLAEMAGQQETIAGLAARVAQRGDDHPALLVCMYRCGAMPSELAEGTGRGCCPALSSAVAHADPGPLLARMAP